MKHKNKDVKVGGKKSRELENQKIRAMQCRRSNVQLIEISNQEKKIQEKKLSKK